MSYIAGHFNCYYNTQAGLDGPSSPSNYTYLGSTRAGFTKTIRINQIPITDDQSIDAVKSGIQSGIDMQIRLDYVEYDRIYNVLNSQGTINSSGSGSSTSIYAYTNAGLELISLAGTLVLVAVVGTPAAAFMTTSGTQVCYQYPYAIITSDFDVLMSSKLRQGPCTFKILPWYVTSNPITVNESNGLLEQLSGIPSGCSNSNVTSVIPHLGS